MSNTYFKYSKTQTDKGLQGQIRTTNMSVDLTAYVGGSPNTLQLTVSTSDGRRSDAVAYITMTQQEQDELICGILERRGVDPEMTKHILSGLPTQEDMHPGISATGYEQSLVHPAELPEPKQMTRDEVQVSVTLGQIFDSPWISSWDYICEKYGLNLYCISEGRVERTDTMLISLADAEKLGIIASNNNIS